MSIYYILLTLLISFCVGLFFCRLKVPGGMLVGGIIGAAILNIIWDIAYIPKVGKIFAQSMAGAFIGSSVKKNELGEMRRIAKPAAILLGSYLIMNLLMGWLLYTVSPISAATAWFSAVPGGINDIPLIAADMGANAPQVAILQFVRLVIGVGVFPGMIQWFCRNKENSDTPSVSSETSSQADTATTASAKPKKKIHFWITMGVAFVCGMIGNVTGIPAGILVFALAGTIVLNLTWGKAFLPPKVKRFAQLFSGAYIGCSIGWADVLQLRYLILPAILITAGYTTFCVLCGHALQRFCKMSPKEAMLAATPAGASDMALISMDLGVQSTDLVLLQVLRLIVVSSLFPQVIQMVLLLLPS
ncbi:MAG TPA: AbrB family transcriptional regulator [Clostridiales bacterium]|nr:AbrB family transcriptional regulator [Clostridiales bacterium]